MTGTRQEEALQFVRFLYQNAPPGSVTTLSFALKTEGIVNWKNSVYSIDNVEAIVNAAISAQAQVYIRIPPMERPPRTGRGLEADSIGSAVLWVDVDAYDVQDETVARLEAMDLPPTLIVDSGYGLQAYWALGEFSTDLGAIKRRNKALKVSINGNGPKLADSCFDLARVMRVPGTYNLKRAFPKLASIRSFHPERVYSIGQFVEAPDETQQINVWEEERLPEGFLEEVRGKDRKTYDRITTEDTAIKAGAPTLPSDASRVDRSRNDQWLAVRLLSLGYTAGQVMSVLTHPNWFSGARFREKGRYDYVVVTVNKALGLRQSTPDRFFNKSTFQGPILAQELMGRYHYLFTAESLWIYENGVYNPVGEQHIRVRVIEELGNQWQRKHAEEVIRYVRDLTTVSHDEVNMHKGFVNVQNGMLDLQTRILHSHHPRFRSLAQLPLDYDAAASTEEIDAFVGSILQLDAVPFFWEYLASCLIRDTYWPKAFVSLVGPGNTGKSKLLEFVRAILGGDKNCAAVSLQTIAENRFSTHSLFGKLANIFADLEESEAQSTGQLKALTGSDVVEAEKKFKDAFRFVNRARLWFSANHFPPVRSPDEQYFERAYIVPCINKFEEGADETDPFILERMIAPQNLSGGFIRMLEGYERLLRQGGFTKSPSIELARQEYKSAADTITGFVEYKTAYDGISFTTQESWYMAYHSWCRAGNRTPFSDQKFYRRMMEGLGKWGLRREYKTIGGKQRWCYVGRKIDEFMEFAGEFQLDLN